MGRIITDAVYNTALLRIEELLPFVTDDTPIHDRSNAVSTIMLQPKWPKQWGSPMIMRSL